jgi:hypothetical protein
LILLDPLTLVDQMKYRRRRRWHLRTEGPAPSTLNINP